MRTRWLIALVSVVALLATACDSAQDEPPADPDSDDEARVDDGDVQQRLEDAIATTIEQGPAEFTATSQHAVAAGSAADSDEDVATDTDRTTQVAIEGSADFGQGLREMSLVPGGSIQDAEVSVILDRDDLYLQRGDDAASGEGEATGGADGDDPAGAQWARVDLDELVDVESRASRLLLHDPYPMLNALQDATVDVREGTPIGASDSGGGDVEDEGTTSDDDSVDDGLADQPDIIATIDLTESDQPALQALSEPMGSDELDLQVWVEPAVADGDVDDTADDNDEAGGVDERVQQLAISLPAEAAGELVGVTEDAVAADDDWELMIELTSFGSEDDVEAPEDDEVIETDADAVRAMLGG